MAVAKAQPKYQTYKKNVQLAPNQSLAFTAGKGYYAAPKVVAPKPVVPKPVGGGFVPNVPAPPGSNPVVAGPGVTNPGPNYGADLVGDPDFTEANANYQYNLDLAHKQRQNRVRAALIRLGFQPGGADAQALAGIDPSTAELAQQNSESALAQLGLQRGKSRADLSAELASRGMLDTGALRGGENMVQSAYDQGLLGATQDYLNEQNTALSDEATTLATGQQTYTAAKAAAALAAAKNPLFTPTPGAGEQGDTLAPGQGTRPDQTPALAAPPTLVKPPVAVAKPPARFYTYKNQVPLKPGQTLKFAAGKGYYAG
jgi:hypothetical protein